MNFSDAIKPGEVVLELKYCERCGGLWLRSAGDQESYCDNCRLAMAAWPRIGKRTERRKAGGLRARRRIGNAASEHCVIDSLCGVAEEPAGNFEWECIPDVPEVRV